MVEVIQMGKGNLGLGIAIATAIAFLALAFFFTRYGMFIASGYSMEPTFSSCMAIGIDKWKDPGSLMPGDIVAVNTTDGYVVHRVVDNVPSRHEFSTRGDNSSYYQFPSSVDGYFDYSRYIGSVVYYASLPIRCGYAGRPMP